MKEMGLDECDECVVKTVYVPLVILHQTSAEGVKNCNDLRGGAAVEKKTENGSHSNSVQFIRNGGSVEPKVTFAATCINQI